MESSLCLKLLFIRQYFPLLTLHMSKRLLKFLDCRYVLTLICKFNDEFSSFLLVIKSPCVLCFFFFLSCHFASCLVLTQLLYLFKKCYAHGCGLPPVYVRTGFLLFCPSQPFVTSNGRRKSFLMKRCVS